MAHSERCPACAAELPAAHKEHPEDRRLRLDAEAEALKTIGPFWRRRWRAFVALVQTYGDLDAHEQLERLRSEFWGRDLRPGPAPTAPRSARDEGRKETK